MLQTSTTATSSPALPPLVSDIELHDAYVTIVHAVGYGPIAEYTLLPKLHRRGEFQSIKTETHQPWESEEQRWLIETCEARSDVYAYLSEPFRIEMHTRSHGTLVYRPDLFRRFDNGVDELIEAKKSMAEIKRDRYYELKIDLVRETCHRLGWTFSVIDRPMVSSGYMLRNAQAILPDKATVVSTAERIRLLEAIEDGGGRIGLGEAVATLSGCGNYESGAARAKLNALIVRRVVGIDLNRHVDLFTPVEIIAPTRHESISDMLIRMDRPTH